MNVLAVNCGSSSLKFRLATGDGAVRLRGAVAGIGSDGARLTLQDGSQAADERSVDAPEHAQAVRAMLAAVHEAGAAIEATGHRVVHGGDRFDGPARCDDATLRAIEEASRLAPLHNAPALAAIRAVQQALGPDVPAVATFDTTFHRTMPDVARLYPIPADLAERHGLRRYGFHGLAHRWMVERFTLLSGRPAATTRIVTLQLGAGCSACAVAAGLSVEKTMGLTPLEGLMMATRSGNVDPALATLLAQEERRPPAEIVDLLNHKAGMLGVSDRSADVRVLLQAREQGDERARLALAMFVHRVRMAIGGYAAVLGGIDGVVFGGGIGEHAAPLRAEILASMEWLGLRLDSARNAATTGRDGVISTADSAALACVVAVEEEALIVRDTLALLAGRL
jgi:acetate kinase